MLKRVSLFFVLLCLTHSLTLTNPDKEIRENNDNKAVEESKQSNFIITPLDDESDIPEGVPVRELSLIKVEDSTQHRKKLKNKQRKLKQKKLRKFIQKNLALNPVHQINWVNKFIDNLQDKLYKQSKQQILARKKLLEDYQDVLSAYHRIKQQGSTD